MKSRVVMWATANTDQQALVRRAMAQCRKDVELVFASDEESVLDYLLGSETRPGIKAPATPEILFMDAASVSLNVVHRIKGDPRLRRIPVVAYGPADVSGEVGAAYQSGVNAFVPRPESLDAFCRMISSALAFWFEAAKLPGKVFAPRPSAPTPAPKLSTLRYRIDVEHRVGKARLIGRVTGVDLLESIENFLGDPRLLEGYKILADYTAVQTVDIDPAEARSVAQALFRYRAHLESGQTAAVVSDKLHLLIGEMLITAGRLDRGRVRMFTSMPDALAWLGIPEAFGKLD